MNALLSILESLELNQTVFVHFGIFLVVYLFLHFLIFKPYFNAFLERKKRTEGSQESAGQLLEDVKKLEGEYQEKARAYNSEYKTVYDNSRLEANKEQDRIIDSAKQKIKTNLENRRNKIEAELEMARKQLAEEVPGVSQAIVDSLSSEKATL